MKTSTENKAFTDNSIFQDAIQYFDENGKEWRIMGLSDEVKGVFEYREDNEGFSGAFFFYNYIRYKNKISRNIKKFHEYMIENAGFREGE